MIKTVLSVLFLCLASAIAQGQSQDDAHWIELARSASVSQIEQGLPTERFDQWFADLVKPSETVYEVRECSESLPSGRESQQRLLCVTAYAKPLHPGWRIWLRVSLAVGVLAHSANKGEPWAATPVPCRFIGASEGPSDPRMKRPTNSFSKLKDVETFVRKLKK